MLYSYTQTTCTLYVCLCAFSCLLLLLFLPVFASFSCLVPLRLVMHPFVTFLACLRAFSGLSLRLILPAFAPLLVRKCALSCLTLLLSLPAFVINIACLCVFSCLHFFHPFFGNFAMSRGIFWYYRLQLATKQVLSCLAFCICLPPFAPCFLALICCVPFYLSLPAFFVSFIAY